MRFIILALGINSVLNAALSGHLYQADISSLEGDFQDLIGIFHGKCGIDPESSLKRQDGEAPTSVWEEVPVDALYLVKEYAGNMFPERVIYELDPGCLPPSKRRNGFSILYREFPASKVKSRIFLRQDAGRGFFRSTLFPWYLWRKNLFSIGKA